MRLHTNRLTAVDIFDAARIARVEVTYSGHGSRIAERSWDVALTGESRRHPNRAHYSYEYAATWDQWGVFFAVLFDRDPDMLCGSGRKYATYVSRGDFHFKTGDRFRPYMIVPRESPGALAVRGDDYDGTDPDMVVYRAEQSYWPDDYHGDHSWEWRGVIGERSCRKCSAVRRWRLDTPAFDTETTPYALSDCKHWDKPGTECSGPRVGVTPDGVVLCEGHFNATPALVGV